MHIHGTHTLTPAGNTARKSQPQPDMDTVFRFRSPAHQNPSRSVDRAIVLRYFRRPLHQLETGVPLQDFSRRRRWSVFLAVGERAEKQAFFQKNKITKQYTCEMRASDAWKTSRVNYAFRYRIRQNRGQAGVAPVCLPVCAAVTLTRFVKHWSHHNHRPETSVDIVSGDAQPLRQTKP